MASANMRDVADTKPVSARIPIFRRKLARLVARVFVRPGRDQPLTCQG